MVGGYGVPQLTFQNPFVFLSTTETLQKSTEYVGIGAMVLVVRDHAYLKLSVTSENKDYDFAKLSPKPSPAGPGSQKDRHRGTSGAKEGFSSIGRFSKK